MKLLLDQNLSFKLVTRLLDLYPDSDHVRNVGLASSDDIEIWEFAKNGQFTIISKDEDFHQMSFLYGAPPKVIWLQLGNCTNDDIEHILRKKYSVIEQFITQKDSAFLILEPLDVD